MLRVAKATPLDGHHLHLEFSDGVSGDVDCSFLLRGTLGEALRDPEYFQQVRIDEDLGTVVWPNGLDPAPGLLHGRVGERGKPAASTSRDAAA